MEPIPEHEYAFRFESGRLCLDFVATVGERWRRSFERLRSPADLASWFVQAGMMSTPPRPSHAQLDGARELREAIYRTVKPAPSRRPHRRDVETINRWASRPPLAPRLGPGRREVSWSSRRPVHAALATIARDAIDLVSGPWAGRVRECARDDCALLFVDMSRPGRRRWCSMEACGNRTKTAAYRRRRRQKEDRDGAPAA